ncbi:MAG: aspartate-semialdehyde dehydrogenase [Candidatus Omnitrophica bacterium]|nr:aspartate-semialdehyde dehydrogenase [Candidatus Omnitrophota bacterium]
MKKNNKKKYNVAVVGVGAVGAEMLRVLKQHNFPVGTLKVLARSARKIKVDGQEYNVEEISDKSFEGMDFALFAGTEGAKGAAVTYASVAVKSGAVVIDNGADFRMEKDVPLIVPEVNAAEAKKHKGIIANPNCSTIQMVAAIAPIYKTVGIKRIIVSTYQAASGAGKSALKQLWDETAKMHSAKNLDDAVLNPMLSDKDFKPDAFSNQLAFNLLAQIGGFADDDYTSEEWKMVHETHKILKDKKIKISATCIRVPVLNSHSESVYLETSKPITPAAVKKLLAKAKGVVVVDDPKKGLYPMPGKASGTDQVYVGRIRRDPFVKNGLWLWIVSDNLRKGAAANAVQIAECLI